MISSSGIPGGGDTFNNFTCQMPNRLGAGNCLVLCAKWGGGGAVTTPTVSDSINGSWGSPVVRQDSGFNTTVAFFVFPNSGAGKATVSIVWPSDLTNANFQYDIYEWKNVAQSSPVRATAGATNISGSSISTGSLASQAGDLVLAYTSITPGGQSGAVTSWTPAAGFTLLQGDIWWPIGGQAKAAMYQIVSANGGAVTPSFTVGDSADTWGIVAIALKRSATPTGTPIPHGIHVNRVIQFFNGNSTSGATMLVPMLGNLRVMLTTSGGAGTSPVITDSEGNTWSIAVGDTNEIIYYQANTSPNQNLVVTATGNAGSNGCFKFFDIQGAAASPLGATIHGQGATSGGNPPFDDTTLIDEPVMLGTSLTAGSLLVVCHGLGEGPCIGFATKVGLPSYPPADAVFINTLYTDSSPDNHDGWKPDNDQMDSGDIYGMYYVPTSPSSPADVHFNWDVWSVAGGAGGIFSAAEFKAA